jgi:phage terminase large subunit-like protein
MRDWVRNTAEPENANLWKKLPELMKGRKGFAALDLGSNRDITAKVWLFPPEDESGRFVLVPQFWIPEDTVKERDTPRTPFGRWVKEGAVQTTPGNVTDYDFIEHETMKDIEERGFRFLRETDDEGKPCGIGYDAWNATQVMVHLTEQGLPVRAMRQGVPTLAAPTKELERLFMAGRLEHGNHPVLRWMFGNAIVATDPKGNITPDKGKAADKIDGVVCTVMALGLWQGVKQPVEKAYQMIIV